MVKLVFTGGGSGGHLQPALALISSLTEGVNPPLEKKEILYIGSHTGLESKEVPRSGIRYRSISTGKLRRYFSLENFKDLFRLPVGFGQALNLLMEEKPLVVFSTGGFVGVPSSWASAALGIPLFIHEQTISVGLANRLSAPFAQSIYLTFPHSLPYFPEGKSKVVGMPVRDFLFKGTREGLKKTFNFNDESPTIYVTGGGQGSRNINQNLKGILPELLLSFQVIHQCGKPGGEEVLPSFESFKKALPSELQKRYEVKEFFREELADILNGIDLLVGRSGAGTVFEAATFHIPSLFIPLSGSTMNEQVLNGEFLQKASCAELLLESELTPQTLLNSLKSFTWEKIGNFKKASQVLNLPNASKIIGEDILTLIKKKC